MYRQIAADAMACAVIEIEAGVPKCLARQNIQVAASGAGQGSAPC